MINYVYFKEDAQYPEDVYARPSEEYPEYPFPKQGYAEQNDVYTMIRNTFSSLKLDAEHMGTKEWNPLGIYIKPGNTVLLKPNLVKHENGAVSGRAGLDCMTTHMSVIRCVMDYVLIALQGTGRIIIADAPVQGCDFNKLMECGGYRKIEEFYKEAGYPLRFEDLRSFTCVVKEEQVYGTQQKPAYDGIEVNVGTNSYFYSESKEGKKREKRLRITNYDHNELLKHHNGSTQQYLISEAALCADVVINLPKPKCHRKGGYTGALKNFVGINTSKEYLPHHTKGSWEERKGDEFLSKDLYSKMLSSYHDKRDVLEAEGRHRTSRWLSLLHRVLSHVPARMSKEQYSEGSWWGNDTIWRMVLDINYVLLYADKNGVLRENPQRTIITIGDMLICGEKEGPMLPSPKKVGAIMFSDNTVLFDLILVKLMGFIRERVPVINQAIADSRLWEKPQKADDIEVCSNKKEYSMPVGQIRDNFHFVPSEGWKGHIEEGGNV